MTLQVGLVIKDYNNKIIYKVRKNNTRTLSLIINRARFKKKKKPLAFKGG
jgi:hypothetical protein